MRYLHPLIPQFFSLFVVVLVGNVSAQAATVTVSPSTGIAYQPITIDLDTDIIFSESGTPNPFLDRRLNITLTSPSNDTFVVPGYFAGDGSGPTTTSNSGEIFRVRFTPTEAGAWSWLVNFRAGTELAVDLDPLAGTPGPGDGLSGTFTVNPPDATAPGFFAKGRLRYVGGHYLQFLNGDYYVKGGVDSPENWLGYVGFDNTFDGGAGPNTATGLHEFPTHAADWNPGDPDWNRTDPPGTNDGRAIIGALNYLHSTGVNSIYFLPMNIGGDGKDSWPYIGPINPNGSTSNDNTRFDNSKLAQWDIFFNHAQSLGILLHFVLNEAEAPNKQELDNAELGVERKLFYREMIARFGYHNAIQFNISEEYNLNLNLGVPKVLDFAAHISAVDPYDIPVTVHNAGAGENASNGPWSPFYDEADIDLTSIQDARQTTNWGDIVEDYRTESTAAGRPLPVMVDEPGSPTRDFDNDFDEFRKRVIWPILMSGGGGEWFINNRDQALEDFREFDKIWTETGHVVRFFEENLPFNDMLPSDGLISGASNCFEGVDVFALTGQVYAVYYGCADNTGMLDLTGAAGELELRWFNPRNGNFEGGVTTLVGGGMVALGAAPNTASEDWAALITVVDCNENGIADAMDIADMTSADCNANLVPDECEPDADGDGAIDDCDACPTRIPGDINGDTTLDTQDASALASVLVDPSTFDADTQCAADVNEDGEPDGLDVAAFAALLIGN